jgi:hypothetical protein
MIMSEFKASLSYETLSLKKQNTSSVARVSMLSELVWFIFIYFVVLGIESKVSLARQALFS